MFAWNREKWLIIDNTPCAVGAEPSDLIKAMEKSSRAAIRGILHPSRSRLVMEKRTNTKPTHREDGD